MKGKKMNIKRIIKRCLEELDATVRIAKVTSIKEALITFLAKIDIQIMNHNGYKESLKMKKHLLKKHEIMIKYYEKTFSEFLDNYKVQLVKEEVVKEEDMSKNIWVCWWQGKENAPEIVKKCINSIERNAGTHPVIILTEDNYKNYVDIPEWVEEKYKAGIITRTNYSDLLRLSLLAKHGGMWLDSTFLCAGNLSEYFELPIWSIKRPDYGHASVACGNFAGYSLACDKEHKWVFKVIKDFFLNYWKNNNTMVDYLMVDYMIVLAQRKIEKIRKEFKNILPNNPECDELFKILNEEYDAKKWERLKKETRLFKLTWKQSFVEEKNGKKTFYGKLLEEKL